MEAPSFLLDKNSNLFAINMMTFSIDFLSCENLLVVAKKSDSGRFGLLMFTKQDFRILGLSFSLVQRAELVVVAAQL